jgi:hypothetical protein
LIYFSSFFLFCFKQYFTYIQEENRYTKYIEVCVCVCVCGRGVSGMQYIG